MNANELTDPRDRGHALRAEQNKTVGYEELNKAFDFYRQFHRKPVDRLLDLDHNEVEAVLAIAAAERYREPDPTGEEALA